LDSRKELIVAWGMYLYVRSKALRKQSRILKCTIGSPHQHCFIQKKWNFGRGEIAGAFSGAHYICSLLLLLGNLGGDSIHIGLTLLGESLTHQCLLSVLVLKAHLSNELSVLELNEAVSDALTGSLSAVLSACSHSLLLRVVLSKRVHANLTAHVELVCHGGGTDVEPVWVVWRQVLVARSFIVGCPFRNADLVTFLEELGVFLDEFLGGHVLDGHALLVVDALHVHVHLCVRLSFLFN